MTGVLKSVENRGMFIGWVIPQLAVCLEETALGTIMTHLSLEEQVFCVSSLWVAHNLNARVAAVAVRKLVGWGDGQEKIKGEGG
jgi:hypothetical protein